MNSSQKRTLGASATIGIVLGVAAVFLLYTESAFANITTESLRIYRKDPRQTSANPLIELRQNGEENNQPLMILRQKGKPGGAAHLRMFGPGPGLEVIETDQDNKTGKGKWRLAWQGNKWWFNSRNKEDDSFERIAYFAQVQQGGGFGLMFGKQPTSVVEGSAILWAKEDGLYVTYRINNKLTTKKLSSLESESK